MKKLIFAVSLMLILLCALPGLAANEIVISPKDATLFEGDTLIPEVMLSGDASGGTVTWSSGNPKAAAVSEDGEITAVSKGKATITAMVKDGKRSWKAVMTVNVARRVTKVTLNTKALTIRNATDPAIAALLTEVGNEQVIVMTAGKSVNLSAVCTPEDATSRKVRYATSDIAVAKISGENSLKAEQRGECTLTVSSVQNPEVTETYRVLVIQPIKKLTLSAGERKVAAGSTLQASFSFEPANASIPEVSWNSRNPKIATVDEKGVITGIKKGNAVIEATARDGSNVKGTINITVTRTATGITLDKTEGSVVVGGSPLQLKATVLPAETNDKGVTWESSDSNIATVAKGKVTGLRRGEVTITARSVSNPELTASAVIRVVQRVTGITFNDGKAISIVKGESAQLSWTVEPRNASVADLTFSSNYPKVVSVDEKGVVTGHKRGAATITAKAIDKSGKTAKIRVTVTQPVEGVKLKAELHHVQLYDTTHRATAITTPKDANNQNMIWTTGDPAIASAHGSGNVCVLHGNAVGTTTLMVTTEDGGYTAVGEIRVQDYNGAVLVEGLMVDANNQIRITMRNMSEFGISRVRFRVDCFDREGNPLVCNTDGVSTSFTGYYPLPLEPTARSVSGAFRFDNAAYTEELGSIVLTVTEYTDGEGYTWVIPEDALTPATWNWKYYYGDEGVG